jgi:hypothetical protein
MAAGRSAARFCYYASGRSLTARAGRDARTVPTQALSRHIR